MAMTPPPTIAQTGDALAVLTAAAGSLSITNVSLWAAQTVVGPLISAPIETLGVLFRTVLGMSGGGDHLRLVACQPSINVVIFTRHVVSSACACGVALIGVSAVWPLIRGSVRRAAAKGQQGLVDISSALLALQGKSGGGGGHPHQQAAANEDALSGTATTSASTTSSSATWPPHQSAATAAQPQPAAAGTLQATLEEIVSLQRTKPVIFGQRIAAIVQRGLWWVQGRVAGWFVRCVVLSSAMLLISAVGDQWLGHRCPVTHVAEGTAYRTLSLFQFYDLCVTMPGRWELRWPGLCQWPMYFLKAFPMGYLPSIVRQAPSSLSATTSVNAAATAAADGVRVLTEGQIAELIRLWRWPAYTAWYLVCNPLAEATECAVDYVVARLGEWSRLLRGGRTHHRHHHHHNKKKNNQLGTHTDETAAPSGPAGAAAAEAPNPPSRGTSPNRVDSNQPPHQQSAPPLPPAPAAEEPRPVTLLTRALGVTIRTAICAAMTAAVVCIGERCSFLDRLPIVGGRGASYAAASMLLAVLP